MKKPDVYNTYKYIIDSSFIIYNENDTEPLYAEQVSNIEIEKDYDNDFLPVFKIQLSLDDQIYHKLLENKTTSRIKLRICQYECKDDVSHEYKYTREYINEVFCFFTDEDTPFVAEEEYIRTTDVVPKTESPMDKTGKNLVLYLFKEESVLGSKEIFNVIFGNSKVSDMVAYLCAKAGITKVLMSPVENNVSLGEFLIPPTSLTGALQYINEKACLYNKGMQLFLDISNAYILNKNGLCTAWRERESKKTIFDVCEANDKNNKSVGSIELEETTYVNIMYSNVSIHSNTVVNDQLRGNNIVMIYPKKGKVKRIEPEVDQRGKGTYKFLVNTYENERMENEIDNRIYEENTVINLSCSEIDLNAITINKEFSVTFQNLKINEKYSDVYRLSHSYISLSKVGEDFVAGVRCTLKRIKR